MSRTRREFAAASRMRGATLRENAKVGASHLFMQRVRSASGRKVAVEFGMVGALIGKDPRYVVAEYLRRGLARSTASYLAGVCRRIDPKTGEVIGLIDPVTREERKP